MSLFYVPQSTFCDQRSHLKVWLISSYIPFPLPTYTTTFHSLLLFTCVLKDTTWTIIQHNNTNLTRVKSANRENPHTVFFKYSASLDQLQATINHAEHCEQELAYHCKKSRLLDKPGK